MITFTSRGKVLTGLVLLFVAGMVAGAAVTALVISYKFKQARQPGRFEAMAEKRMQRLFQKLDLSQEQREKIRPIVRESMEEYRDARQDYDRRMRQIRRKSLSDIREELTPAQTEKLNEMLKKMDRGDNRQRRDLREEGEEGMDRRQLERRRQRLLSPEEMRMIETDEITVENLQLNQEPESSESGNGNPPDKVGGN